MPDTARTLEQLMRDCDEARTPEEQQHYYEGISEQEWELIQAYRPTRTLEQLARASLAARDPMERQAFKDSLNAEEQLLVQTYSYAQMCCAVAMQTFLQAVYHEFPPFWLMRKVIACMRR